MPQPLRNPPTADVERIVKLVAERNNLKQHCRGLQASVLELQEQLQECPTQHDVSQRLVHMEENNASMAAQINELLGQLVASEEQVLAGNARAEEYERRLVSATTARDRQIEELKHTIAELHAQNEEVLSFNSSTRAARDVALRDVTDAKAALEDLKDTHKEECLETSRKHSAATREIEAQLAVEVSVRQQKEAECFELATLLEEARSAADEVSSKLSATSAHLEEVITTRTAVQTEKERVENELHGLRRDVKERDVALSILKEEVGVYKVECELLRRFKRDCEGREASEARQQHHRAPSVVPQASPSFASPSIATPAPRAPSLTRAPSVPLQAPQLSPQIPTPASPPRTVLPASFPSPPNMHSPAQDALSEMEELEREMKKIADRWKGEVPGLMQPAERAVPPPAVRGASPTLTQMPRFGDAAAGVAGGGGGGGANFVDAATPVYDPALQGVAAGSVPRAQYGGGGSQVVEAARISPPQSTPPPAGGGGAVQPSTLSYLKQRYQQLS